jgi:hypothetical protein
MIPSRMVLAPTAEKTKKASIKAIKYRILKFISIENTCFAPQKYKKNAAKSTLFTNFAL